MRFAHLPPPFLTTTLVLAGLLLLGPRAAAQTVRPFRPDQAARSRAVISFSFPETNQFDPSRTDLVSTRIKLKRVTVRAGDTAASLLAREGVRRDATSLSLLYDLNPALEDLRFLRPGERIVLPAFETSPAVERAIGSGYRIALHRESPAANFLFGAAPESLIVVGRNPWGSDVAKQRYKSWNWDENNILAHREVLNFTPAVRAAVLQMSADLSNSIQLLNDPGLVISTKVRAQFDFNMRAMSAILREATALGVLSPEARERLEAYRENIREMVEEVRAGGSALVLTQIVTKDSKTGAPVSNLRVWYAPSGARSERRPCSRLSTPSVEAIARGEYLFWATRDNVLVSDEVLRKVRKATNGIPVELSIIR